MNYLVVSITELLKYEKYIHGNRVFQDETLQLIPLLNKKNEIPAARQYNTFINDLPADAEWIIFCEQNLEFCTSPLPLLAALPSSETICGLLGEKIVENTEGKLFREFRGSVIEKEFTDTTRLLGLAQTEAGDVDVLAPYCLMVHAHTLKKHELRFDESLSFLQIEDFCLAAKQLGIGACVVPVAAKMHVQHSLIFEAFTGDPAAFAREREYCLAKYSGPTGEAGLKAGLADIFAVTEDGKPKIPRRLYFEECGEDGSEIYSRRPITDKDVNYPIVLASKMMAGHRKVLDVGCANGDNGIYLKNQNQALVWGMEYNPVSIERAKNTGIYERVFHLDLNMLNINDYSNFYGFFDYILLADVLEHVLDPVQVLKKLAWLLKPKGYAIVSLPNLAHAYPLLNLLEGEFKYLDSGILDTTHVRFFTRKSIAAYFAKCGFAVRESSATFVMPDNFTGAVTPKSLPMAFYNHMLGDHNFLVCQYVALVQASDLERSTLEQKNAIVMQDSVQRNPAGFQKAKNDLSSFIYKVNLTHGRGLSDNMRQQLKILANEGKYIEAVLISGLFDEVWYRKTYSDINFKEIAPLAHYLNTGWKEGKNPSQCFDTNWFLEAYPMLAQTNVCPLLYCVSDVIPAGLPFNKECLTISTEEYAELAQYTLHMDKHYSNTFVDITGENYVEKPGDTKLIAFYLPQYAPFPENDAWWGKGFTEWTMATKALPQFAGHYQPHLPYDLGFYDLRLKESMLRQVELAKMYGIHGFCYHYYWFDGKKLMEGPINKMLHDESIDLPFCISWANEPWSALWDGSNNELLLGQPLEIDTKRFFDDILPFFKDKRYIKVDEKPVFMIYRVMYFPLHIIKNFVERMRQLAVNNGLNGLHVVFAQTGGLESYSIAELGCDAFIDFPPHMLPRIHSFDQTICNPRFKGKVFNFPAVVSAYKTMPEPSDLTYRTVFPSWDNTARRSEMNAWIFKGTSPQLYQDWLAYAIEKTQARKLPATNMVFINAWNEWAEGAHLEPDRKYGYAFLEATKAALSQARR